MRLYLSSFHLGNQPGLLTEMLGENRRVALIMDAGDALDEGVRAERVEAQTNELGTIGVEATDLDLRRYFGRPGQLKGELQKYGGVWVPGGNTFVLRRAMHDSGFDDLITAMLREDRIAYGGYSAGICVLAPTLKGIDLADDAPAAERVFGKEVLWDGLGILSYMPVPHFKSDHPESSMMDDVVEFLRKENLPFKTLRDGEAIYIVGQREELLNQTHSRS
jgi:dipeptidase E